MDQQAKQLLRYFFRAYPGRTEWMVLLLFVSGLSEGIGIAALLPVLELGTSQPGQDPSLVATLTENAFRVIGLEPTLGALLIVIVVAMALKGAFRWLAMREVGFVVAKVGMDLRLRLIRSLMKAEWGHFTSNPTGYFASSISFEAQRAAAAYKQACTALALVFQVAVYALIAFLASWKVAFFALLVGGFVHFLLRRFIGVTRSAAEEQVAILKSLMARLTEVLPGLKPIKAMAREQHVLPLLEAETEEFYLAQRRQVLATETMISFQEPLLILAVGAGLYLVLTYGSIPFSIVLVLTFLFYRLVARMNAIQIQYNNVVAGANAFVSIMDHIRSAEDAVEVRPCARFTPLLENSIRIVGVSFSYEDNLVLDKVDLEIPAGTLVALLGPSGSGKTTLADMLVGFRRPQAGQILVDEASIDEMDIGVWRSRIGYVPQDLLLFRDTVLRNVTLGDESVTREEVEKALRAAGAWSFVSELPGGVDCVIGERGGTISGGERQRIAIARALVGSPEFLVLDEATTALDPETERGICESLAKLKGQVTILAISHQMALRGVADQAFEIRGGRVYPVA